MSDPDAIVYRAFFHPGDLKMGEISPPPPLDSRTTTRYRLERSVTFLTTFAPKHNRRKPAKHAARPLAISYASLAQRFVMILLHQQTKLIA